jgi:hypothetical protein
VPSGISVENKRAAFAALSLMGRSEYYANRLIAAELEARPLAIP